MAIKDEQQPLEAVTTPQIGSSDPTNSNTKLVNRVGGSKSPFVSAKARDAVAWQLLDGEAVEAARRSNKLIFLHIGYKACHCESLWDGPRADTMMADDESVPDALGGMTTLTGV
jgi:hypothetical protein